MQRIPLNASERIVLGKKVKSLRKEGLLPGHVFGNNVETEHVSVNLKDFLPVLHQAGETGLIDLKIGAEKIRPVMIRGIAYDPIKGDPLHVDFYQVNLKEKVTVPVPIVLIGDEPESVHLGEAVVLQTLSEVEVEALPTDLIDKLEVDISRLQNIDDAINVADLNYNHETITVLADPEELVVKLATAVVAEPEEEVTEAAEEASEEGTETTEATEESSTEESSDESAE